MSQSNSQRVLIEAMSELIMDEPDFLERGVPPNRLLEVILSRESSSLSKRFLESVIGTESSEGRLTKMSNGNYCLASGDGDRDDSPENSLTQTSSGPPSPRYGKSKTVRRKADPIPFPETAIRVGERRKRAKKVFDPSDNNLPSKKRKTKQPQPVPVPAPTRGPVKKTTPQLPLKRPNGASQKSKSESAESTEDERDNGDAFSDNHDKVTSGVCSVCRQQQNSKDTHGKLIECRDCSNKAHLSCLRGDGMLKMRPDNTWQCPHCKTCVVCIETNDAGVLTVCSICADAYHALCHSPEIPEESKAWNRWKCRKCVETQKSGVNLSGSIETFLISEKSSRHSDYSEYKRSGSDKKTDKSAKSTDSDDKNEKNSDKDEHSVSPSSSDKGDWKYTRKSVSPVVQSSSDSKSESNGKKNKSEKFTKKDHHKQNNGHHAKLNANSIFLSSHNYRKLCSNDLYKKHPRHKEDDDIDPTIPDAEPWSHQDVYQYFSTYFPDYAHIFKDHEIDGKSLLLLRRHDVIANFDIPHGFALKIYRLIVKLQSRKDDYRMCWL